MSKRHCKHLDLSPIIYAFTDAVPDGELESTIVRVKCIRCKSIIHASITRRWTNIHDKMVVFDWTTSQSTTPTINVTNFYSKLETLKTPMKPSKILEKILIPHFGDSNHMNMVYSQYTHNLNPRDECTEPISYIKNFLKSLEGNIRNAIKK